MSSEVEYTKEFEKIILKGDYTEALKNITPNSIQYYLVTFIQELKKCYSSKKLSSEVQKLLKEIEEKNNPRFPRDFISECKSRLYLLEYELPDTKQERKKEIIDFFYKEFNGANFNATKPAFAKARKEEKVSNASTYPSELTEELFNKEAKKRLESGSKYENIFCQTLSKKEILERFEDYISKKKTEKVFEMLKSNIEIEFYLLKKEKFMEFINILNSSEKENANNCLSFSKLTLEQIKLLVDNMKNEDVLDKNNLMSLYINKKYEPQLSLISSGNLTKKRDILIQIYNEVKDLHKFSNYISNLLLQILILGKKIEVYDLELFKEYIKNPLYSSPSQYSIFSEETYNNISKTHNNKLYTTNKVDIDYSLFYNNGIITDYLKYFFLNNLAETKNFENYLKNDILQKINFQCRILKGEDVKYNPEKDSKLMSKYEYEELIKKTELTICEHNKKMFDIDEDVIIDLDVKNINSLTISIYEINTENYYLEKKKPISSTIVVEGLITQDEQVIIFQEKSQQLIRKQIKLEKIPKKRGVYLIEFLGNQISSRAIIKKGNLNLVTRNTSKGKLCFIVNEKNEICNSKDTYIWYNKEKYYCEQNKGMIVIPYNCFVSGATSCILCNDNFSDFAELKGESENINLDGVFYFNHESLITGTVTKVLFKPTLFYNNRAVPLSYIKNGEIIVNISKLENGIKVPVDIPITDVKFEDNNKEYEFELQIPPMVNDLTFTFNCEIISNVSNKPVKKTVTQKEKIDSNRTDTTNIFLRKVNKKDNNNVTDYILEILGKNGEKIKEAHVLATLTFKDSTKTLNFDLQTDEEGKIKLCDLDSKLVSTLKIQLKSYNITKIFDLDYSSFYSYPSQIDLIPGEGIKLPFYCTSSSTINTDILLLKHENNNIISLLNDKIIFKPLNILNDSQHYYEFAIKDLDVGNYLLYVNRTLIKVQVHNGEKWTPDPNYIIVKEKNILVENSQVKEPIHLTNLKYDKEKNQLEFSTASSTKSQHAHIFMYQYLPNMFSYFAKKVDKLLFENVDSITQQNFQKWENIYLSNRLLNEEIQYVLNRKNYEPIMGNSLEMPSLLLKRQFTKKSKIDTENVHKGNEYEKKEAEMPGATSNIKVKRDLKESIIENYINDFCNFIQNIPYINLNILPKEGSLNEYVVPLPDKFSFNYSFMQLYLIDELSINSNLLTVNNSDYNVDVRPTVNENILDNQKNYSEIRKTELHYKGEKFTINETSNYKIVDTIEKLLNYLLVKNERLRNDWDKIKFILNDMTDEKSFLEKYSENISHEVNIFMYFKYPELFNKIIKPILQYKFEKTFIDYFLLDDIDTLKMYLNAAKIDKLNTFELCLLIIKLVNIDYESAKKIRNIILSRVHEDNIESILSKNFDIMMNMKNEKISEVMDEIKEFKKKILIEEEVEDEQLEELDECCHIDTCEMPRELNSKDMMEMNFAPNVIKGPKIGGGLKMRAAKRDMLELEGACMDECEDGGMEGANQQWNSNNQWNNNNNFNILPQSCMASAFSNTIQPRVAYEARKELTDAYELGKKHLEFEKPGEAKEYKERHYLFNIHKEKLYSPIWLDFADHILKNKDYKNFISKYILYDQQNICEIVWILSVLDIPIKMAQKHSYQSIKGRKIEITPSCNMILFTKEIGEVDLEINNKILISQNISKFKSNYDQNENVEFSNLVKNTIYSQETIITNISNKKVEMDVFIQIPEGAIPMDISYYTQTNHKVLDAYFTLNQLTHFYFPKEGIYKQYHPIAIKNNKIISMGESMVYNVKDKYVFEKKKDDNDEMKNKKIYNPDTLKEIIANGENKDIIEYFKKGDFCSDDFHLIHWLLKDKTFYDELIKILRGKGCYDYTIYSYGFHHYDELSIKEVLNASEKLKKLLGPNFKSSLYSSENIDDFKLFPHLEYSPVFNARIHKLGKGETQIDNVTFKKVYEKFIIYLLTLQKMTIKDYLRLSYYLVLQDRLDEALNILEKIDKKEINNDNKNISYKIQYDYLSAYLDISLGYPKMEIAKSVCNQYKNFPLLYWREKFEEIEDQINEYEGKDTNEQSNEISTSSEQVKEKTDKEIKKELESSQPQLSFTLDGKALNIIYSNIDKIYVKFYFIDLEILFSRSPSLKSISDDFSFVKPNFVQVIDVEKSKNEVIKKFDVPKEYVSKNIFIELSAESIKKYETYFSSELKVMIFENLGELKVIDSNLKAVPKAYVKVFADLNNGKINFYKDGYTDFRGKFDYLSLNTDQLKNAQKFYIFVSDDNLGAVIQECKKPFNFNYEQVSSGRKPRRK